MSEVVSELALDDIEFLRAVREVNETPDEYPDEWTRDGKAPATVRAIREVSGLSEGKVQYRLIGGSSGRGFGEDGLGLLVLHDPPMRGSEFGPKSAELTEPGEQVLEEAIDKHGLGSGDGGAVEGGDSEEVAALAESVRELQSAVEAVQSDVDEIREQMTEWEDDDFGGIDPSTASKLRVVLEAFPAFNAAFRGVLGVPLEDLEESDGELTDEQLRSMRSAVQETITEGETQGGTDDGGGATRR